MRHEPRGFEGHAKGTMKLIRANAFLAGNHKEHRLKPKVHRHMAGLENSSNFYSKGLAALIALISADPGAFALHFGNAIKAAAMRANRAFGPYAGLYPSVCGLFFVEVFI